MLSSLNSRRNVISQEAQVFQMGSNSVFILGTSLQNLSWEFGLMGWPPQPPKERVPKINEIVGF